MNKNNLELLHRLLSFVAMVCVTDACTGLANSSEANRPNFVLIYADDLGYADLGCYGNGYHETPNIDRLMKDGIRFTQAYSDAPLCAPSRIALLTGRHSVRAGCYEVAPGRYIKRVNLDFVDFLPPENTLELPADRKILPEYLKQIGYRTGCFGKWHVGSAQPGQRGFNEFVTLRNGSHLDARKSFVSMSPNYPPPRGYSSDYLAQCAEQFLDNNMDRPFFLYLPHTLVHTAMGPGTTPLEPKPELLRKYQAKAKTQLHGNPAYAAMVEALDQAVGQTIDALRSRRLLDNTVVIFTSDNGGLLGGTRKTDSGLVVGRFTSNSPLRSGKAHLYEGGIRVPTSFSHGGIRVRGVCSAVVSQLDLLPTVLKLAKHPQADTIVESFDGQSLVPLLRDAEATWPDREIFWHYPGYRMHNPQAKRRDAMTGQRPESVIRHGNWKLIESLETGSVQLYDLATDIGETNDLSTENPEVVNRLRQRLDRWRIETNAPMPKPKPEVVEVSDRPHAKRVQNDIRSNPSPAATLSDSPAGRNVTSQCIPNPGFEEGDKTPQWWAPNEWRSRWAFVPGQQGHGRCLRLEGSGKSPLWRSAAFPLDARCDYTLSARLRTDQIGANRAEVFLDALDAEGKFLKRLGKGWPTYRLSAGVSARESTPWHEVSASIRHQDIPEGTTQACVVCCVETVTPCDGFAFFDDLACRPDAVTSEFRLLHGNVAVPGNLGFQGKPVTFVFDIYAPELAGRTIDAKLEVKGYFGVTVRQCPVRILLDDTGTASVEVDQKPFSRTGWFSIALQDDSSNVLCRSALGMVDPALPTSAVDPASPYGVGSVQEQDLEIARRAGIKAVRHSVSFNVQWGHVEPKQGSYRDQLLTKMTEKPDQLARFGIQSGIMIGGWSPKNIPSWAQQPTDRSYYDFEQKQHRPTGNYSLPAELDAWQAYLSRTANAFSGQLAGWEIWNENDLPQFWQGSVDDYLTLLRTGARAIRAADPQAKIAMCGISTTIVGQEEHPRWFQQRREEVRQELDIEFDPLEFLERVLRDGKDHFDILNFHPYGTVEQIEKGCRLFRDAAARHGCEDRPFWITETGVGTHVTGPLKATPQEQARRYWQIHAICRAHAADRIFWLSFVDLGRDRNYHWDNFGLLDLDRVPKPALLAQAALARHLGDARFSKRIPLKEDTHAYEFDRDGVPVTMIWSDRHQRLRCTAAGNATVRDIMGNLRNTIQSESNPELSIGPDPILLIGDPGTRPK